MPGQVDVEACNAGTMLNAQGLLMAANPWRFQVRKASQSVARPQACTSLPRPWSRPQLEGGFYMCPKSNGRLLCCGRVPSAVDADCNLPWPMHHWNLSHLCPCATLGCLTTCNGSLAPQWYMASVDATRAPKHKIPTENGEQPSAVMPASVERERNEYQGG